MHTPHPINQRRSGMTLIELLVVVSLLTLMLFLVNDIFSRTSEAVQRSTQTSKVLAMARSTGEQIKRDTDAMIGPGEGTRRARGYLVILNSILPPDTLMLDPNTLAPVEVEGLRADQIVFIREGKELRSMTLQNGSSGSNLTAKTFAKVVYGIGERANEDGMRHNQRIGTKNAGIDQYANDFILTRHTLLFDPYDPLADQNISDPAGSGRYTFLRSAFTDVDNNAAADGAIDVTSMAYTGINGAAQPGLIDSLTTLDLNTRLTELRRTAFINERLLVNTRPDLQAIGGNYNRALGQTHGIFAQSCSEFVVQFAADLDGNGLMDTTAPNDDGGEIIWYDGFGTPNNAIVTEQPVPNSSNPTGWYRSGSNDPNNPPRPQPFSAGGIGPYQHAFVFSFDDDGIHPNPGVGTPEEHSDWPFMIRIRYRLHDTRGRLTGNNRRALIDGFDNDGDGAADANDPENDEDQISGRWFEHIIAVPRPR